MSDIEKAITEFVDSRDLSEYANTLEEMHYSLIVTDYYASKPQKERCKAVTCYSDLKQLIIKLIKAKEKAGEPLFDH